MSPEKAFLITFLSCTAFWTAIGLFVHFKFKKEMQKIEDEIDPEIRPYLRKVND